MVSFDFDDDAADAIDKHSRADQLGRHLVYATVEKSASQALPQRRRERTGR
jgi:hypothetical protein